MVAGRGRSARFTVTVPVTWSPVVFRPRTAMSTSPSSRTSAMVPVNVSVSPAKCGTPRRMLDCFTIASGPAQSVT